MPRRRSRANHYEAHPDRTPWAGYLEHRSCLPWSEAPHHRCGSGLVRRSTIQPPYRPLALAAASRADSGRAIGPSSRCSRLSFDIAAAAQNLAGGRDSLEFRHSAQPTQSFFEPAMAHAPITDDEIKIRCTRGRCLGIHRLTGSTGISGRRACATPARAETGNTVNLSRMSLSPVGGLADKARQQRDSGRPRLTSRQRRRLIPRTSLLKLTPSPRHTTT